MIVDSFHTMKSVCSLSKLQCIANVYKSHDLSNIPRALKVIYVNEFDAMKIRLIIIIIIIIIITGEGLSQLA